MSPNVRLSTESKMSSLKVKEVQTGRDLVIVHEEVSSYKSGDHPDISQVYMGGGLMLNAKIPFSDFNKWYQKPGEGQTEYKEPEKKEEKK